MKILLQNKSFYPEFGGIETSLFYIARELKKMGHTPVVFTCQTRDNLLLEDRYKDIKILRYKSFNLKSIFCFFNPFFHIFFSYRKLCKIFKNNNFDYVWSRSPEICYATHLTSFKGKIVYIPPRAAPEFYKNILNSKQKFFLKISLFFLYKFLLIPIKFLIEKKVLNNVSQIIVFSENVKKELKKIYKKNVKDIKIVNPGVDAQKFKPRSPDKKIIKKFNIKKNDFIVLCVSRMTLSKNIISLIRVIKKINNKKVRLLLVGSGKDLAKFKKNVNRLGLKERVIFTGYRKDVEKFYNLADLFVLPSKKEGFGQVFLEAMSSGVPCLGYKSNNSDVMVATEEIIQDNQTGFLLSDYSIDSMANKVQWIYNQKRTQLKEMGKIARKKCLQEYNWSDFCNKILSFIQ